MTKVLGLGTLAAWVMLLRDAARDRKRGCDRRRTALDRHGGACAARGAADELAGIRRSPGVSDRIVSRWEAGGHQVCPRPVNQAALDESLRRADHATHERFAATLWSVQAALDVR